MAARTRCEDCYPRPLAEMARTAPALVTTIVGRSRRAVRARSKRRRKHWLRGIRYAVSVWTLPLGVKTVRSPYHPQHPTHFTSCGRAMKAHYPGSDYGDILKIKRSAGYG